MHAPCSLAVPSDDGRVQAMLGTTEKTNAIRDKVGEKERIASVHTQRRVGTNLVVVLNRGTLHGNSTSRPRDVTSSGQCGGDECRSAQASSV